MQCREKHFNIFFSFLLCFWRQTVQFAVLLFSASRQKDTITRVCFFKRIFLEGTKNDFKGSLKCFKVFLSVLSVGFYQSLSLQFFGFSVVVCFLFIFHTSFLQQVIIGLHGQDINQSYGFLFWEEKKELRKKGKVLTRQGQVLSRPLDQGGR